MPRASRVCSVPGCGTLTQGGRCQDHKREAEQKRGTAHQRGYDYRHQQERTRWKPRVQTGRVACAKCKQPITTGQAWDLGHTLDRTTWTGPECLPCNRGHR